MNKELATAIAALDSKIFWSIVVAVSVSAIITAVINYFFNVKLAEEVRRKNVAELKLYESRLKIPESTNLLQHEKRIKAIEEITELQRLIQEWTYDHQALQSPTQDDANKASAKEAFEKRWIELNEHLRKLSVYFIVNHSPYLEKYKLGWEELGKSVQEFLDIFTEAQSRLASGGSGQYTFSTDAITESANSLKIMIFVDAAEYE